MSESHDLLAAAEDISVVMEKMALTPLVIGAVALAAHHYIRFTQDLDFAIDATLSQFQDLGGRLEAEGFQVVLHSPDAKDPLGGVIDVTGSFGLVQIVNFGGRFPAAIRDALAAPPQSLSPQSTLRVIPLPQLVALKLYAGGLKSKADLVELLRRNPDADFESLRKTCASYRLPGLDEVLAELECR